MISKRRLVGAHAALAVLCFAAPAHAEPNGPILAAVQACDPGARALIEQLVAIDSGTGDVEGLDNLE